MKTWFGAGLVVVWCCWASAGFTQTGKKTRPVDPLAGFRTVETAITTQLTKAAPTTVAAPGYLGINVRVTKDGKLVVAMVEVDSPAARAGLKPGDIIDRVAGREVVGSDALRELLKAHGPGDVVKLAIVRAGQNMDIAATLGATSRVLQLGQKRAILGVQVGEPKEGEGAAIRFLSPKSPAGLAGLKVDDVILKIDGMPLPTPAALFDILAGKKPGDSVAILYRRAGADGEIKVRLAAESTTGTTKKGGWDNRILSLWKKDVYRLAVVCIEYPDVKHNLKITSKDWQTALFSRKIFTTTNTTGGKVYGSMNDYYQEQSFGALRVEGKVFDFVQVSKKRAEYSQGSGTSNKSALLVEAVDKLRARDGMDALQGFDGIFFLYAGERFMTNRGGLYWPHRASFSYQGKMWPYFICPEGGSRMSTISVICHEFGHMLGLPDLYARPENPGSEGVGAWCAMSNQIGNGRPQHFSAWSKERLAWIKPALIDPTVKQKLILSPIEDSPRECYKVLVRPDGSEYFLLENRKKKGFDTDLPAEGLLIWRVLNNKVFLEESHGIEGPSGPRVFLNAVPFPSQSNNAFTPYTIPSSRSQLGGGLPVHITNIRRLPDGRITFYIGYEYL